MPQLRYSPVLLAATTLAMALTFLAAVRCSRFSPPASPAWLGAGAWGLMVVAFQPTLRFYRLCPLWGLALPAIALVLHGVDDRFRPAISRAAAAASGRDACRRPREARDDARRRTCARGKGHRDENFPVASRLIQAAPPHTDHGLLRFRAHGGRRRRSRDRCRRRRSSRLLDRLEATLLGGKAMPSPQASRCAPNSGGALLVRSTPATC